MREREREEKDLISSAIHIRMMRRKGDKRDKKRQYTEEKKETFSIVVCI